MFIVLFFGLHQKKKPPLCKQPHEIRAVHCMECERPPLRPPSVASTTHPPLLATRLLLTLVCPNKPFMLQQFGAPKGKKNIYYGCGPNLRPHTDTPLYVFAGADRRHTARRGARRKLGHLRANRQEQETRPGARRKRRPRAVDRC